MSDRKNIIPVASLAIAVLACIIALSARGSNRDSDTETEKRVYARVVAELAKELEPVYRDFGIKLPRQPEAIAELARPLLSVANPDVATSSQARSHNSP